MFSSRRSYFSTWCNTSGLCLLLTNVIVLGELSPSQRPNCEFKAANYSLEWAFEPVSKNVVFVLKAHSSQPNFWTGIGFGRPNEPLDFIGVLAKNGQAAIIDAHVDEAGVLAPDTWNNVQSIEVAFDTAHNAVLAKFARPITSGVDSANDRDLTGCVNFNLPLEGGALGTSGVKLRRSEMKIITVCDIEKQCAIEIRGKSPNGDQAPKAPLPEVAHSVDLSGSGDPCSFQGAGYTVNWTYNPNDDTVDFVMKHSAKVGRWWSAVGIGEFMADMDIGIVFIENGNVKKIADFYSTAYDVPEVDQVQDWTLDGPKTKKSGDSVEIHFSRAIDTKDGRKDKSLDGCVLFQFAANGGRYGDDFDVHKHEDWPDLYKACDLKKHCVDEVIDVDKRANPGPGKKGGRRKPTTTTPSPEVNESNDETTISPVTEDAITAVDNATTDVGLPSGTQGAGGPSVETTTWGLGDISAQNGTEATTTISAIDNLIANSTASVVLPVDSSSPTLNTSDSPVTPTLNLNFNDGTASTVNDHFTSAQPIVPQGNPDRLVPSADGSVPPANVPLGVSDTWTTVPPVVPTLAGQPSDGALNGAPNNLLPVPVKSQEDEINGSGEEPSTVVTVTGGAEQPTTTQSSASPIPDTSGKIDNASLAADSLTPIRPASSCDPLKPDLPVCTGYMDNYFTQVKKWADKHNESVDGQLGKACKLLSAVPHVPSLCCSIFNDKCGGQS